MSLFVGERPSLGRVHLVPTVLPTSGTFVPTEGTIWYDANLHAFQFQNAIGISGITGAIATNVTPVTDTNPTAATALQTYAFPAGALNVLGKTATLNASGVYTTDSGTGRTITLSATLGAVSMFSFTTGATTASQTGFPWQLNATMVTTTTGATGVLTVNGQLAITLGASIGGAQTIYGFAAASSAVDLTVAETLSMKVLFSGSNAGNTFTENILQISTTN